MNDRESRYEEEQDGWRYVTLLTAPKYRYVKGKRIAEFRGRVDGGEGDFTVWEERVDVIEGADRGDTVVGTITEGKVFRGRQQYYCYPSMWKRGNSNGMEEDDRGAEDRESNGEAERRERKPVRPVSSNDPLTLNQALSIIAYVYPTMMKIVSSSTSADQADLDVSKVSTSMQVAQALTATVFIAITNQVIAINRSGTERSDQKDSSADVDIAGMVQRVVNSWKKNPLSSEGIGESR